MERRKVSFVMICVVAVACAIVFVTASALAANTPLYTVRMEQASHKMGFLPTAINEFTYTAEKGVTVEYTSGYGNSTSPYSTGYYTCPDETCEHCLTYPPAVTCQSTCEPTCQSPTCPNTCQNTCPNTCQNTCPNTCQNTCPQTCPNTCQNTCPVTCDGVSCPLTCDSCLICP
jgi:hypothetical protein